MWLVVLGPPVQRQAGFFFSLLCRGFFYVACNFELGRASIPAGDDWLLLADEVPQREAGNAQTWL